ncbi:MAG: hypothetical protein H6918_05120 [Sphingomonadaceae bacterium]|nr:hypothetical protein [Sphingomonadaceae bacterium]
MRAFRSFGYVLCAGSLLTMGCSDNETEDSRGLRNDAAKLAEELVTEDGCDPAIAAAIAPFGSDYGECRMPQFTELCGQENKDRGIAMIGVLRERETAGLNPWAIACAREGEPVKAIEANCRAQNIGNEKECSCAAKRTAALPGINSRRFARLLAHDALADTDPAERSGSGSGVIVEDDLEHRNAFFAQVEACQMANE